MVVDSSALAEQVVADVVNSAFDSAGQRCSALRVLCVQRDGADRLIEMLQGAMRELRMGDTRALAVDVGPVIDEEARAGIERHIAAMRASGRRVSQPSVQSGKVDNEATRRGTFVAPTLIEIDDLAELEREVFGPVLHVLRYGRDDLGHLLEQINGTGYGLTLGVHTRIDETVAQVVNAAHVGNVYVNRNVVGAVVGVQPFGGEGLSGTGPKAGGPLYLLRLLAERPSDAARKAVDNAGIDALPPLRGLDPSRSESAAPLQAFRQWAAAEKRESLAAQCDRFADHSPVGAWHTLAGPTGEANLYAMRPREAILCLAATDDDRLFQLAAVLAVGSRVLWPAVTLALWQRLPVEAKDRVALVQDWRQPSIDFDAVLHHGDASELLAICAEVAARPGPIVGVTGLRPGAVDIPLERLVIERSLSVNTAAAGGNASLMTMG
jgi:RHH-type proline utilization regulon transcriptional repressor/proline dehydrogenase/delta 1-pyrroline-5-carboxylate dehydrogenase